jgi:hypothetical protein
VGCNPTIRLAGFASAEQWTDMKTCIIIKICGILWYRDTDLFGHGQMSGKNDQG